jgi:hypothetical protein
LLHTVDQKLLIGEYASTSSARISYSKILLTFIIHKGVQQGDVQACFLFNITLEYTSIKSGTQTRSTIFYKSVQLMAYADDSFHWQVFSINERRFSVT